jgi:hypothetical protein
MRQNKIVIIMFFLLVFASQTLTSVAGPMAYHSMQLPPTAYGSMIDHKASLHNAPVEKNTHQYVQILPVTNALDCCKDKSSCPMSVCMSMASIIDQQWIYYGSQVNQNNINLVQQELPLRSSSLYRPPILS